VFDFGVVNTTDDDCDQQTPTAALCLPQFFMLKLNLHINHRSPAR